MPTTSGSNNVPLIVGLVVGLGVPLIILIAVVVVLVVVKVTGRRSQTTPSRQRSKKFTTKTEFDKSDGEFSFDNPAYDAPEQKPQNVETLGNDETTAAAGGGSALGAGAGGVVEGTNSSSTGNGRTSGTFTFSSLTIGQSQNKPVETVSMQF
jgi:hypothetical protein